MPPIKDCLPWCAFVPIEHPNMFGNDLGFTEITIAALLGHAKGSITSKYIHVLDATLITAADMISGYVDALLKGARFQESAYSLDRTTRKNTMSEFLAGREASTSK